MNITILPLPTLLCEPGEIQVHLTPESELLHRHHTIDDYTVNNDVIIVQDGHFSLGSESDLQVEILIV